MASAAGGISRGHLPPEDSDLSTIGLCHSYEHVQKLLQSFEMDDQENPGHETAYQMLTRCGLDIGSGEHKAVIATVDAETGKIHEVLYEKAHQVLLQCDMAASGNKCLSPEIIKKSDDTLQLLKEKCIEFGVDSNNVRGVCTAVFRRAENGPDQVRKINEVFSYGGDGKMDKVFIIKPEIEAEIGLQTCKAASKIDDVISWDSGGGSYQITYSVPSNRFSQATNQGEILTHCQGLGDADAADYLCKAAGKQFAPHKHMHPVSEDVVDTAMSTLITDLHTAADWLQYPSGAHVVGFGGQTAMFYVGRMCSGVEDYLKDGNHNAQECSISDKPVFRDRVEELLKEVCSMDWDSASKRFDEMHNSMAIYPDWKGATDLPEKELILPKLMFLLAVMKKLDFNGYKYVCTTGNCLGVAQHQSFWQN